MTWSLIFTIATVILTIAFIITTIIDRRGSTRREQE